MADTQAPAQEAAPAPGPTTCSRCGKTEDHPKVHVLGSWVKDPNADVVEVVRNPSFHHDCLPEDWVAKYEGDPTHARMLELRRAAIEDGLRGDALRAHNDTLPDDNDPAIAEAYAASLEA